MRLYIFTIFVVLLNLSIQSSKVIFDANTEQQSLELARLSREEIIGLRLSSTESTLLEQCPSLNTTANIHSAIHEASITYDLESELLLAIMVVESRCRANATSHVGAMGLMQLMPSTADWLGVHQPYSVRDNVLGGSKYIAYLMEKFDGRMDLALAAYNAGPGNVQKYNRSIPPFKETKKYVSKVMSLYENLRMIADNETQMPSVNAA